MPRERSSRNSKYSLRRSLRSRKPGRVFYQTGDVVEISLKNKYEIGTLVCRVRADRWIVKYKNNDMIEQKVCEKYFGDVLQRVECETHVKVEDDGERQGENTKSMTKSSSSAREKGEQPILSAREKRMRVRQEINDVNDNHMKDVSQKKQRKTKFCNKLETKHGSYKDLKSSKRNAKKEKEEVVKVKLNTGTLYLYRGMNPRAAFVRRY